MAKKMWKKQPGEPRSTERGHAERRGPRGARGAVGPTGPTGPPGPRGSDGLRGKTGSKGSAASIDSLEAVNAHIGKIDHELRIQLQRMAQIQQQLDEVRGVVQRLTDRGSRDEIPAVGTPPAQPKTPDH